MSFVSLMLLAAILVIAASSDLRERRIPNWLAGWGLGAGLLLSLVATLIRWATDNDQAANWLTNVSLSQSFYGALVVGILPLLLYLTYSGGAGDVKLAWAIGALLGLRFGLPAILATYVLSGAWGLVWFILTGRFWTFCHGAFRTLGHWLVPGRIAPPEGKDWTLSSHQVAMAPFMAVGVILALASGVPE